MSGLLASTARILYNIASCWLYLKEYINDARYHECQKSKTFCTGIYLEIEDSGLGLSYMQVHHIFGYIQ